jgi:hypothetical protein
MTNKIYILLIILLTSLVNASYAQVGIGNTNPDSNAVLDLSNTKYGGLMLPKATSSASMVQTSNFSYYFDNYLYFRKSTGYTAISPWVYKVNGSLNRNLYYNLNGNIGIGNTNLSSAPEAPLQIETYQNVSIDSSGSLMIGALSGSNLVINAKEIQTRNATAASTLQINKHGGDLIAGDISDPINVKVTGKVQELDSTSNSYYDVMPKGLITAWFGVESNIPVGWAICDGGTYPSSNGLDSITTPDLRGRFIVSAGNNGTNNYAPHDVGGEDLHSLSTNEIPSHYHKCKVQRESFAYLLLSES